LLLESQCRGLQANGQKYYAEATVLCAGAWSGAWWPQSLERAEIRPIKGQMLLFKTPPGWLKHIILAGEQYLIPRQDGHILAGSSLEDAGFAHLPTRAVGAQLYRHAISLLPELAAWPCLGQWSGLRPGSGGNIPYIGPIPQMPGLWVNSGHFRYGLTMGPGSAWLLADLMTQQTPSVDATPYGVEAERPPLAIALPS